MKWLFAIALAACTSSGTDKLPIVPGGGGIPGGTGGKQDAAVYDGNDGGGLAGRVCLVGDARALATCASAGAEGLTVTLGGATAMTAADGTFTIAAPQGTNLTWHVTGTNLVTSVMAYSATPQVPALTQATYNELLNSNGIILVSGQGSLFVRVLQAGAPLAGATASILPAATEINYEGTTATAWDGHATGAHGVAWIAGEAVGNASVTVTPPTGTPATIAPIPVEDGAITFVATDFP